MPSFPLKVTRLAFAQLEKASPVLAGRIAFELFCRTPSRRPKGAKAKQVFMAGRNRLRQAQTVRLALSRGKAAAHLLPTEATGNSGHRILVVHGWGSRAEYLSDLALGLRQTGAEVVVLDLPGHGASSGRRLDLKIAAEAIVAAERHFGRFDGVVGHSFGGAAVLMRASGASTRPAALAAAICSGWPPRTAMGATR